MYKSDLVVFMKQFQSDCGLNEDWEPIIDDDSSELGDSTHANEEQVKYFLKNNETDFTVSQFKKTIRL